MTDTPLQKPGRTWLYVGLGFVVFWGIYLTFFAPSTLPGKLLATKEGPKPDADYSWKLLDLDDQPIDFSEYRGKTVFLNIWATWCGPCVQELPSIARLANNPKLKNVSFLCVSTDDSSAKVKQFLTGKKGWPMTVLRATDCPSVFQTEGIPATFLIGPDGKIAASQIGSMEWDDPSVVEILEKLQAGSKGE